MLKWHIVSLQVAFPAISVPNGHWLLEGPVKLGTGTGVERVTAKREGFLMLLLWVNLFSSIQIIRKNDCFVFYSLVGFCFVSRFVSFDCLIFPFLV